MLDLEDKKTRYWGAERNERRRQRYRADIEYRKKVREQTRQTYRRHKKAVGQQVRADDCIDNVPLLTNIGRVRAVEYKNGQRDHLTLTVEEMAKAFGRNQQVMYRWFAADMFPRPAATVINEHNRKQPVYLAEEAEAAMIEFSVLQKTSQYYRERHTETRDKIFDAVYAARAKLRAKGMKLP